ncbi:MAG: hypothetical protein L0207_02615 [Chlamydiae bacterium]|nr:hypothetical protein [Chlamydiota bacterium]
MNRAAWVVCKALLQQVEPHEKMELLHFLSDEQFDFVSEIPETFVVNVRDKIKEADLEKTIHAVHHSWFAPYLRTFTQNEIIFFLSALSAKQGEGLRSELRMANHPPKLSLMGKTFLLEKLFHHLSESKPDLLPSFFLPGSSLNFLLDLKYEFLKELIFFLGLHDLAVELKQIIETAKLKKVYSVLNVNEKNYLNFILSQPEPLVFKRFFFQTWDGKRETLVDLLEKRGLNRLGRALYNENTHLAWHCSRHLDLATGQNLLKWCMPTENKRAGQILRDQIIKIYSFFKTEKL